MLSLARIISDITDKDRCETYVAPFDVRFSDKEDEEITTVVHPDISVCNGL